MRIAVIGAGALGLFYGAKLQRSGQELHFLLRRDYQAISQSGLRVDSVDGNFHLEKLNCYRNAGDIGPVELVLVGLKTFANQQLVELVRPLIGPNSYILTLQNGLGSEELLAQAFGAERVLGGIAFLCSNRGEPGRVQHLGEGKIRLGEFSGGLSRRAQRLAEMFNAAEVPCEAVGDLSRARWEKLVWNMPFNGLSALLGKDVTELLAEPPIRELIAKMMYEVVAAANAQPLVKPIDGPLFIEQLLNFTAKMDHYQPSMMIDRQEGRQLELEAIYANPLQRAAAVGSDMPRTAMLHTLLANGESKIE